MINRKGQFIRAKLNDSFFQKESQELYWLIGLLAADGCVKDNRVNISQSGEKGFKLIKYIKKLIGYKGKIYKSRNAYIIQFTSNIAVNLLKQFNVVEKKSLIYKFPKIKKQYLKSFIRGYFDGDGSVGVYYNKKSNSTYLCTSIVGTKDFIFKLQNYVSEYSTLLHIKRVKNLYELRWNGQKGIDFLIWLYTDNKLYKSYKYNIFKNYLINRDDRYTRYLSYKNICKKLYNDGFNPNQIWIKIDKKISFQTIYEWRNNGSFN